MSPACQSPGDVCASWQGELRHNVAADQMLVETPRDQNAAQHCMILAAQSASVVLLTAQFVLVSQVQLNILWLSAPALAGLCMACLPAKMFDHPPGHLATKRQP